MKPAAELVLGGRYRLVRRIAVGGMGEVWVASDQSLGREVAVKVLREEYAGNEDFLERLRTEARNSAALSHPNIAQMYDYGEQRGSGYLVMELVVGEPMADLLEREPVIPPGRLMPILAQTARALHAAHTAGVVHRDVKPGNILIARNGEVKITDFGVSLAANQVPMTATGMVMGTAQYLSPEQAIGQPATAASDIYALGIVAYESVAGKRPFTGSTPVDIAVAHVNETVPALPSSIDAELAALIMAMLAKDPVKRPLPADELAVVLDDLGSRLSASPWSTRRQGSHVAPAGTRRSRRSQLNGPGRDADGTPRHGATPDNGAATESARPTVAALPGQTSVRTDVSVRPREQVTSRETVYDGEAHGSALDSPAVLEPLADETPGLDGPFTVDPWERPTPSSRSRNAERSWSTDRTTQDEPSRPRSYPPRREMHETTTDDGEESPGTAAARLQGASEATLATRAERRRAVEERTRRNATPPAGRAAARRRDRQRGVAGLPRSILLSLVVLAVLLLVLLIVTLTGRGNDRADAAGPPPISSTIDSKSHIPGMIVTASLPHSLDEGPTSAMIAPDVPRADAPAAPTTPKDE